MSKTRANRARGQSISPFLYASVFAILGRAESYVELTRTLIEFNTLNELINCESLCRHGLQIHVMF